MTAQLVIADDGFRAYGAAWELWNCKDREVIIAGPYATGKTMACLHKANALACKYAGSRGLMVRKTYRSLIESACVTFERKVLANPPGHADCPIRKSGGSHPTSYEYPNGSRIVLGGLDNPGKLLSSEWDWIYVNQSEELTGGEWEDLTGRATGRAGNMPYAQVLGDANPGPSTHWILSRAKTALRVFYSRHEDNPSLYDQATGEITDRGRQEMEALDALTGVRYQRGRLGKWVNAEGTVYDEFSRALHLVDRFDPPESWPRIWVVDFGYTNPFFWGELVKDPDGRLILYREIYRTRTMVEDHAKRILALTANTPPPVAIICDHDAEGRATLERYLGRDTIAAHKAIAPGLQSVQARLRPAGDGRPRLVVMRDTLDARDESLASAHKPVCALDEFEVYAWPKTRDGAAIKEVPVDDNNHGLDALRYGVAYVDDLAGRTGVPPPDETSDWRRAGSADTMLGALSDVRW